MHWELSETLRLQTHKHTASSKYPDARTLQRRGQSDSMEHHPSNNPTELLCSESLAVSRRPCVRWSSFKWPAPVSIDDLGKLTRSEAGSCNLGLWGWGGDITAKQPQVSGQLRVLWGMGVLLKGSQKDTLDSWQTLASIPKFNVPPLRHVSWEPLYT